jgi:hypothetical protein
VTDPCDCTPALSRRGFLQLSLGGYLGLTLGGSLGGLSRAWADESATVAGLHGFGQAQHVILLWLNGGPSQLETFDPKPGTPQGGPTQAIKTTVSGIQLAEGLPRLAEQMEHVSLIRSMSTKEGNHQRARYYLHTGYVPSGTVKHPDMGALICQQKAEAEFELPSYITISGNTPGAGLLGVSLAPFTVADPTKPVANLDYAKGVGETRFSRRRKLLAALGRGFAKSRPGPETRGHDEVYAKADRMMHSPRRRAFDVSQEPEALRQAYGESKFGQGCLMARRLVEEGVKVVEVQLNGWDTHQDNFNRTKPLLERLDAGFSTLIQDLRDRELLQKTLVVCMGEFGRTPRINPNEGRDHFARAWSMALAGGGVRGGRVVGATSADGMQVAERPIGVPDLMATIAHASGLDAEHVNYTSLGRPLYLVDEGGAPIKELLS